MKGHAAAAVAMGAIASLSLSAQQVPDTAYAPQVGIPAYEPGKGPIVLIDEAHFNFHTAGGRYLTFARLLRQDGYVVLPGTQTFSAASLARSRVLVIANALPDAGPWVLPTKPAFTNEEVRVVEAWVREGGSLFLIADHMPIAGAAETLARAFGIEFMNGFAFPRGNTQPPDVFRLLDQTLSRSSVTLGRSAAERVDSVATFTGQAFRATRPVVPVLTLDSAAVVLLPIRAWVFNDSTPRVGGAGLLQGALLRHGRGRVAVFGEAAMFSAQRAGSASAPMGMNHPRAARNAQLTLNILHWLTGLLEPER